MTPFDCSDPDALARLPARHFFFVRDASWRGGGVDQTRQRLRTLREEREQRNPERFGVAAAGHCRAENIIEQTHDPVPLPFESGALRRNRPHTAIRRRRSSALALQT